MSVDLNFWKYKENAVHDHAAVYQTACCDGRVLEELEILPVDEILKKVADVFSNFMDILIDFGCPLYDPQISTRFDSWTDR